MQFLQQIALLSAQANESDEDRADRLTDAAAESDTNPETLYLVEEDLRGLARSAAEANEERINTATEKLRGLAPMLGMDPATAEETLGAETALKLATQYALARPDVTASLVLTLHRVFESRGLYADLGTEAEVPALPAAETDEERA